jgi:hypothetical protein
MSDIWETGETRSFDLKKGIDNEININRPVKFMIKTAGGSIIKGVMTPNNPLIVNPADDIIEYKIEMDDEVNKKIGDD